MPTLTRISLSLTSIILLRWTTRSENGFLKDSDSDLSPFCQRTHLVRFYTLFISLIMDFIILLRRLIITHLLPSCISSCVPPPALAIMYLEDRCLSLYHHILMSLLMPSVFDNMILQQNATRWTPGSLLTQTLPTPPAKNGRPKEYSPS